MPDVTVMAGAGGGADAAGASGTGGKGGVGQGGKGGKGKGNNKKDDKKKKDECPPHDTKGKVSYPPTNQSLGDRLKARGRTSGQASNQSATQFEARAAQHNRNEISRLEGEMMQSGERSSAMSTGTQPENAVGYTCSKCGKRQPGEIEHVGQRSNGSRYLAEAKNGMNFTPAGDADESERNLRQLGRLGGLAQAQGMDVVYKIPKGHAAAEQQILRAARQLDLGKLVSVIKV